MAGQPEAKVSPVSFNLPARRVLARSFQLAWIRCLGGLFPIKGFKRLKIPMDTWFPLQPHSVRLRSPASSHHLSALPSVPTPPRHVWTCAGDDVVDVQQAALRG